MAHSTRSFSFRTISVTGYPSMDAHEKGRPMQTGTTHQLNHSSRLLADSGHVLCRRAFLTLDDVKLNMLTFAK